MLWATSAKEARLSNAPTDKALAKRAGLGAPSWVPGAWTTGAFDGDHVKYGLRRRLLSGHFLCDWAGGNQSLLSSINAGDTNIPRLAETRARRGSPTALQADRRL